MSSRIKILSILDPQSLSHTSSLLAESSSVMLDASTSFSDDSYTHRGFQRLLRLWPSRVIIFFPRIFVDFRISTSQRISIEGITISIFSFSQRRFVTLYVPRTIYGFTLSNVHTRLCSSFGLDPLIVVRPFVHRAPSKSISKDCILYRPRFSTRRAFDRISKRIFIGPMRFVVFERLERSL